MSVQSYLSGSIAYLGSFVAHGKLSSFLVLPFIMEKSWKCSFFFCCQWAGVIQILWVLERSLSFSLPLLATVSIYTAPVLQARKWAKGTGFFLWYFCRYSWSSFVIPTYIYIVIPTQRGRERELIFFKKTAISHAKAFGLFAWWFPLY